MSTKTPEFGGDTAVSEQFRLIRRVADDLAHELKNPLNAMVINLELLRTRLGSGRTEAALERIDVLEEEVRRLHLLLDQMLRLIRPDRVGVDNFPVDEVLDEVAGLAQVLAKLERRVLEHGRLGDGVYARAARGELRFAALALLESALRGAPETAGPVRLHGAAPDGRVEVYIDAPAAAAPALRSAVARLRNALTTEGPEVAEGAVAEGHRAWLTMAQGG